MGTPATKPTGLTPMQCLQMMKWPQEDADTWEERAAILEYEAGLNRADAEREAWNEMAQRGEWLAWLKAQEGRE